LRRARAAVGGGDARTTRAIATRAHAGVDN
jgi:hypothetical protein